MAKKWDINAVQCITYTEMTEETCKRSNVVIWLGETAIVFKFIIQNVRDQTS